MKEGLARAKAIIQRHRDVAEAARLFHKARGPRLANVEATLAAHKVAWFDSLIREIKDEEARAS